MILLNTPPLGLVVAALVTSIRCAPTGGPTTTSSAVTTILATAAAPTMAPTAATSPASTPATAGSPAPASSLAAGMTASPTPDQSTGRDMGQTRVRFTVGDAEIIVRTADNPTSRDFVSMLPLTLDFRDFNAMEKIGDLPPGLTTQGSTGRAPANGT